MGRRRNVLRYNSAGLFLSDAPAHAPLKGSAGNTEVSNNIYFLNRVQSATVSIDVERQNIAQIGSEDFLDRKIVSEPNIELNFEYLLTDGYEENILGFNIAFADTIFPTKTVYDHLREDKNAFLIFGEEEFDLQNAGSRPQGYSGMDAIGIGNCFIKSYSIKAGVGQFATASVGMSASNVRYSCINSGSGGYTWLEGLMDLGYLLYELSTDIYLEDDEGKIEIQSSHAKKYGQGLPFPSFYLAGGGTDVVNTGFEMGDPIYVLEGESEPFESPVGAQSNPVIYKSAVSAIPPGGITMRLKNINVGGPILSGSEGTCCDSQAHIQDFNITLPFNREDLYGFSSMHVYGRKMKYPQVGQISLSLLTSTFESGNFKDIFCDDEEYEIEIELTNQCNVTCNPATAVTPTMIFKINNAKLDGYDLNQGIGSPGSVDVNFSFGVSRNNGLFMSGSYGCGAYMEKESGVGFVFSEGGFKILEEDVCPVV